MLWNLDSDCDKNSQLLIIVLIVVYVGEVMQENVLGESRMMIPDCHKRLEAALADLKSTLVYTLSIVIAC